MRAKKLASGSIAYYWEPKGCFAKEGFPIKSEPLGQDYGLAIIRCDGDPRDPDDRGLNGMLDDWRTGRGVERSLDNNAKFGTVDWWFERYYRTDAFLKTVSDRAKPDYKRALKRISDTPTKDGRRIGELPAKSITPAAVDKLYTKLRGGEDGTRYRTANLSIDVAKKAWRIVQRHYPHLFHETNPFLGMERVHKKAEEVMPATRAEAYALSQALKDLGHPHLGVVPLICFEWLQRPENVLEGHTTWTNYRPSERPDTVLIVHHKTGVDIWHPLEDRDEKFYPELEKYLADLKKLGTPIVLTPGKKSGGRGNSRTYSMSYARRLVRKARKAAGLPDHVTLAACRHGGMTELGDAELTEQGIMSLSAHSTPDAARGYVKKTERQRAAAAKKRRAWLEQEEQTCDKSRNEALSESRNDHEVGS